MNGLLNSAIFGIISFIVNGLFTTRLNFIQIPPVSFTPSIPCRCIARLCGLIRMEIGWQANKKHANPAVLAGIKSKGDEPMKNLFKVICKSIALSCVDLVKYYGVY